MEMIAAEGRPRWQTRWWLRCRTVTSVQTADGWSGASEFYCPWWAKPLDWFHRLVFGAPTIERLPEIPNRG